MTKLTKGCLTIREAIHNDGLSLRIAGHFLQAPQQARKGLSRRLLESERRDIEIVQTQVVMMAFQSRAAG